MKSPWQELIYLGILSKAKCRDGSYRIMFGACRMYLQLLSANVGRNSPTLVFSCVGISGHKYFCRGKIDDRALSYQVVRTVAEDELKAHCQACIICWL